MITAIALSFAFKLNKALVLLAANISIPPMIPFILYLSHWTGGLWMGKKAIVLSFDNDITWAEIQNSFFQYMIGAMTLSVCAGITLGLLTYFLLITFNKPGLSEESE